jgi:hypothetical protein
MDGRGRHLLCAVWREHAERCQCVGRCAHKPHGKQAWRATGVFAVQDTQWPASKQDSIFDPQTHSYCFAEKRWLLQLVTVDIVPRHVSLSMLTAM